MDIQDTNTTTNEPAVKKIRISKPKVFCREKANAVQLLSNLGFTSVEDRMLMNNSDIQKNEGLKKFLDYENPTTCQLNMNFLFSKAVSNMDKRLKSIEKSMKIETNDKEKVECHVIKKRKFQGRRGNKVNTEIESSVEKINICEGKVEDTQKGFTAGGDVVKETEEGEVAMLDN